MGTGLLGASFAYAASFSASTIKTFSHLRPIDSEPSNHMASSRVKPSGESQWKLGSVPAER